MSRFDDQMVHANAALLYQVGAPILYWPAGVEDDEIEIDAIFTAMTRAEREAGSVNSEVQRGELQIWADSTRGVETPNLKSDEAYIGGERWVVEEIIETVAGMHRLVVERGERSVMRRGRGRW